MTTFVFASASGRVIYGAFLANVDLTPSAWGYLPYVSRQEPPTPTSSPAPTSTPTNTPTLVSTQVPTPTTTSTPTSSPTSVPSEVKILPNHSYYSDSIDYLHVVGEVQNNTPNHLRFVKVTVNILSGGGQLLANDYTYIYLDSLPAGDRTCFEVFLKEPAGWSYYEFEAPTYWTDGEPLPNLTVFNDSGSYKPTFGWYEIVGQVRNSHGSRVEYVSPVGTVYNASGVVIGCDFTYVNSTHLDPNQTSSFTMTFTGRDFVDVASYRLQVDGNPK